MLLGNHKIWINFHYSTVSLIISENNVHSGPYYHADYFQLPCNYLEMINGLDKEENNVFSLTHG